MIETKDQILTCRDCNKQFVFTEGEQAFFAEKQFVAPTRCKVCRQLRKAAQNGAAPQEPQVETTSGVPAASTYQDEGFRPKKKSGGRRSRREEEDW